MKTKITFIKRALTLLTITLLLNNTIHAQCDDISVSNLTRNGAYNVARLTESDGLRNGPDYTDATLFYPTNATGTYSTIVIVPGFNTQSAWMQRWGTFYASHGIVTFIINTNSTSDSPSKRADALLDAIETVKRENTRSNSPLEGKIDTESFAVSGHSLGGGGSLLAATRDTSIKAIIPLNPFLRNTSNILRGNESATLILSGESDTTAGVNQHAIPHYNNTPNSTEKAMFEVDNGNHQSAFSPTASGGMMGALAVAWLKVYLEEDGCYCNVLTNDLLTSSIASNVETSFSCSSLSANDFEDRSAVTIYPNPTNSSITIKNVNFTNNVDYNITNLSGQLILSGDITSNKQKIDISSLGSSVYFLNIGDATFKVVKTN